MSSQVNCFQIVGAEAIPGIPLYWKLSTLIKKPLPLSGIEGLSGEDRVLRANAVIIPGSDDSGHYVMNCGSRRKINRRDGIVFMNVEDLNFGGSPFLEGLNLWPGAEWHHDRPLWRRGPNYVVDPRKLRSTSTRSEIWVLETNTVSEQLLLVDKFGGVRILKYRYGELQFSEPSPMEMAEYLHRRGEAMTTHRGALWAYKNLEGLAKGFPQHDFRKPLAAVRSWLDDLEVRIQ